MLASDMRKLSEKSSYENGFMFKCLNEIKDRASKGYFNCKYLYGEGTLYDRCFSDGLYNNKSELEDLGYKVDILTEKVKGTLGERHKYIYYIKW